jgi:hypothetical protein
MPSQGRRRDVQFPSSEAFRREDSRFVRKRGQMQAGFLAANADGFPGYSLGDHLLGEHKTLEPQRRQGCILGEVRKSADHNTVVAFHPRMRLEPPVVVFTDADV